MFLYDQVQGLIYTLEVHWELNSGRRNEGDLTVMMKDKTTINSNAWLRFLNLLKAFKGHFAN